MKHLGNIFLLLDKTITFFKIANSPLEIDVSALACATPADFIACGNTGSVASNGADKLENLAVGDEFSTYDYIVRVTEVSGGDKNSGWTGKGELVMNFLKIGSSPVVEIPLAVEFNGINLNQCYQLLAGPKVITTFDPNWSNVVDVDEVLENALTDISDILSSYSPSDNVKLTGLTSILSSNITEVQNNSNLSQEQKDMIINSLNSAIGSVSCLVSNGSNARVNTTSCTVESVQSQVQDSMIGVEAANDRNCNCPKPTSTGTEGDKIVATGTKYVTNRFEGGTTIPCKKTWIYHSGYQGGKYPSDWYYSEDYEKIETFVKDKIGPLVFVHGTFSNPGAFTSDFKKNIYRYLNMSISEKDAIAQFQWTGGNTVADRDAAATEMGITLNSSISKNLLKKLGYEKHIILVCHSHGGNVAKRLKNILEGYDASWVVDVINIETPQRNDFQFNSTNGKVLNFWSSGDLVQWAGSIADFELSQPSPGPLGSRKDPKADLNIQLIPRNKINLESYGGEVYNWIINSLGHSLQGDAWYQAQIYHHINKNF